MSQPKDRKPIQKLMDLTGKNALVTGAAAGIGFAIAYRLGEAGAKVGIADIDGSKAEEAASELRKAGFQVFPIRCDVQDEGSVQSAVDAARKEMGGIHILVNNAGVYPRKPLTEMTGADFRKVISVNLTGTFLCTRYAGQAMIEQDRGGCIINIASIEALHPSAAGMTAYDASKGGVLMLTKSTARELGRHDIRVNAVAPGGIMTRGVLSHLDGGAEGAGEGTGGAAGAGNASRKAQMKELKGFLSRMALGRMGVADDIARVALFLASDLSGYITGEMIVADGGYLIS